MIVPQSFHAVQHRRWRTSAPAPGAMPAVGSMRAGARVVARTRSRLRGAAARRAGGDRHAGAVRAGHQVIGNPVVRHVRRLRLVRDAAARRLRRADARPAPQPGGARGRRAASCLPGHARLAHDVAGRGRDGARRVRRALRGGRRARSWPAPRRRCCSRSSCRSRCPARPRRSPTGWRAGAWPRRASLVAIALLWPAPARDPVRSAAIAACRALAARLRAEVAHWCRATAPSAGRARRRGRGGRRGRRGAARDVLRHPVPADRAEHRGAGGRAARRRAALAERDRRAVGGPGRTRRRRPTRCARQGGRRRACSSAAPTCSTTPPGAPDALPARAGRAARRARGARAATTTGCPVPAGDGRATAVSALDPSFRAQELSFVVVADRRATSDARRGGRAPHAGSQRLLGPPAGGPRRARSPAAQERAGAHVERHSVWLQNSVRGAVGLGLAVLVADLSGVQHAFWVVLGALSVLRSNALSTGQNVAAGAARHRGGLRRRRGARVADRHEHDAAVARAARGRPARRARAGARSRSPPARRRSRSPADPLQHPPAGGWSIGLVRIEDVALGCAVSLVVGLLLWPRGAGAALGRALSRPTATAPSYLAGAVAFGLGRCDAADPRAARPAERGDARRRRRPAASTTPSAATSASGARSRSPLAEVTSLSPASSGLRLAGDAVLDAVARRRRARRRPRRRPGASCRRHRADDRLVRGLRRRASPTSGACRSRCPPTTRRRPPGRRGRPRPARRRRRRHGDAVRVIWTGDHLDAARRLQTTLVGPAREAVRAHAVGQGHVGYRR